MRERSVTTALQQGRLARVCAEASNAVRSAGRTPCRRRPHPAWTSLRPSAPHSPVQRWDHLPPTEPPAIHLVNRYPPPKPTKKVVVAAAEESRCEMVRCWFLFSTRRGPADRRRPYEIEIFVRSFDGSSTAMAASMASAFFAHQASTNSSTMWVAGRPAMRAPTLSRSCVEGRR